jgi:hypothetical protein
MKIFISWSGDLSHQVALAVAGWLPVVLPYVKPWVSSRDIPKGSRWGVELARELEATSCGIICLTPDNIKEPWLNFESGALSKQVAQGRVHPFIFGISPVEFGGSPLSQFQATEFNREEIQKLVSSINENAEIEKLPQDRLDHNFQICWVSLDQKLQPLVIRSLQRTQMQNATTKSAGAISEILTDEDEKTLQLIVETAEKTVSAQYAAHMLGLHPVGARYKCHPVCKVEMTPPWQRTRPRNPCGEVEQRI